MSQTTPPPEHLIIASRTSPLAMWQARFVSAQIQARYPDTTVDILGLTTEGDRILDRPLSQIGGKGLFTKTLEDALCEGRAHLAVHSMKDVTMHLPEGFSLAAILKRENPADAFVSNRFASLANLPEGARIGTSSVRRAALLKKYAPHLTVHSLRGNVDTRLQKLDGGDYDAILLAAAGLIRLAKEARITAYLPTDTWIPSPGQGALGIEVFGKIPDWLFAFNDENTAACVRAERAFSAAFLGNCQQPLGAMATCSHDHLQLRGFWAHPQTGALFKAVAIGKKAMPEALGQALFDRLVQQGASPRKA